MVVSNFFDSERLVWLVLVVFMSFVGFPEVCRFSGGLGLPCLSGIAGELSRVRSRI